MPPGSKAKRVYQCTLGDEFEDLEEDRAAHATWTNLTVVQRLAPSPTLPAEWLASIDYVRKLFWVGGFFSVPFDLWSCIIGSRRHEHERLMQGPHPLQDAISAMAEPILECSPAAARDLVFFSGETAQS
jgi:hypothetical protein